METSTSGLAISNYLLSRLIESSLHLRLGDWLMLLCLTIALIFHAGSGKLWFKPDPYTYVMYVAPQKSGELRVQPKRTRDIGQRLKDIVSVISSFNMNRF